MNVLVLNCGSSTLKFQVIDTDTEKITADADVQLARGMIERIGGHALITLRTANGRKVKDAAPLRDHRAAIDWVLRWIVSPGSGMESIDSLAAIHAAGHRVVHGGERFQKSALIDDDVLEGIEDCIELAPLHNPANLRGIRAVAELLGSALPQAAVFDTALHATMPPSAYLYGIPYAHYRRYKIRRYGFHGTSHRYVAYRYRTMLDIPRDQVNIITLHLGNGCSACAIKGGDSIETSMGFTPLEGLLMGTRAGDLDASIFDFLAAKEGLTPRQVEVMLNKQSGLLGISGITHDMRELLEEVEENDDRRAKLAIEIFCYRVRKRIGAYQIVLGGADALVFTGGIGENAAGIRSRICAGLGCIGLTLDEDKNAAMVDGARGEISASDSPLKAYVIPTNEELLIARDTVRVATGVL